MDQVLLTEQTILPTTDIDCIISTKSNFANYHTSSTTNSSNALIDILENVIVHTNTAIANTSTTEDLSIFKT